MASGRLPGDFWPRAPGFVPPGAEPAPSAEEDSPFDTFVEQMYNEGWMDSPSNEPLSDTDKPLKKPASRNAKTKSESNADPKAPTAKSSSVKAKAKANSARSSKPKPKPKPKAKAIAKSRAAKSKDSVDVREDGNDVDAETLPVASAKGAAKKASVLKKPSSSLRNHVKKPSKKTYPKPGTLGCSKCRYQGCSACLKPQDDDGGVQIDDEEEQMTGDV